MDQQDNAFLSAARTGRNDLWRYLAGIVIVIAVFFGGNFCMVFFLLVESGSLDPVDFSDWALFVGGLAPFALLPFALWLVMRRLHDRPLISLVNPLEGRLNLRRLAFSAGLWAALSGLADLALSAFQPGNYSFVFEPARLALFLVISLLLIPLQISAEELFFRGYLTHGIGLKGGYWAAWIVPSLLFGLLHGANPEVGAYGILLTMPVYIGLGLLLGWITLRSESLELALGLHLANNLYTALLVTFPSSALQTPALFRIQVYNAEVSLGAFVVMTTLYLALLQILGRGFFRKGLFSLR